MAKQWPTIGLPLDSSQNLCMGLLHSFVSGNTTASTYHQQGNLLVIGKSGLYNQLWRQERFQHIVAHHQRLSRIHNLQVLGAFPIAHNSQSLISLQLVHQEPTRQNHKRRSQDLVIYLVLDVRPSARCHRYEDEEDEGPGSCGLSRRANKHHRDEGVAGL